MKKTYKASLGRAANELYAQFFARILREIPDCHIAVFSKLKALQGPNFTGFRNKYRAKLSRIFIIPANTFDNVKGSFPIGFQIWHTAEKEEFREIIADVYNANEELIGKKKIYAYDNGSFIIDWLRHYYDKINPPLAYLRFLGTDFQNNNGVFLTLSPSSNDLEQVKGNWITIKNLIQMSVYFSVRLAIDQNWLNDRDQFLYPNDGWENDNEFKSDCLVYMLFHGQNRVSCKDGINHWIPFTEDEVGAKDTFKSQFMTKYINGIVDKTMIKPKDEKDKENQDFFKNEKEGENIRLEKMEFSDCAKKVINAGKELWKYYHQQKGAFFDASLYDIRLYFQKTKVTASGKVQMKSESNDPKYTELIKDLRQKHSALARQIEPKIYEYGFLKRNYDSIVRESVHIDFMTSEYEKPSLKPKEVAPPFYEETEVDLTKQEVQPITVNIVNNNTFEKNVGAVIISGETGDIKDIIEIKKEDN